MTHLRPFFAVLIVGLAALSLVAGCSAGYQGKVFDMNQALQEGDAESALAMANAALGVDTSTQIPGELDEDAPLLLLERATLLQANGEHELAVRDLLEADKVLEVLDLTGDDDTLGKYLFSDDATLYQVPPHEKLLINTLAMISYLCLGDLESARIEARRLTVLQKFFKDAAAEEVTLFGLGSYLAGFVFEKSGDYDEALQYYLEAWRTHGFEAARVPIAYLGRATGYDKDEVGELMQEVGDVKMPTDEEAEVLVIVMNGRGPYKVAERLPIGAFVVSGGPHHHREMTAEEQERADRVVASGLLKWINFPTLIDPVDAFGNIQVKLDGATLETPGVELDIRGATHAAWEQDKPLLMFAAFTRMVTRAIAAEATTAVGKGANLDKSLFPGASWLLGRVVEGTLTAVDTPDTRSWTTLPANIRIYRQKVAPGTHKVRVTGSSPGRQTRQETVEVRGGRFGAVSVRFLR